MKKLYSMMFAAIGMVAMVGCTADVEDNSAPVKGAPTIITASVEGGSQTRTAVKEGTPKSIVWAADDQFKVFNETTPGSPAILALIAGAGTTSGTFGGSFIDGDVYQKAAYPAEGASLSADFKTLTMVLPASIEWGTQTTESDDAVKCPIPFYGAYDSEEGSVTFKFLTAAIKLDFKDIPVGTNKVTVESKTKPISGSFTAKTTATNPVLASTSTADADKKLEVTFDELAAKGDKILYIAIPAATYDKLDVYLEGSYTGKKSIATWENITFERKKIYTASRTYVEVNVDTPQEVSAALQDAVNGAQAGETIEISVTTGDSEGIEPKSGQPNQIEIPKVDDVNISLSFDKAPVTSEADPLKIVEASTGADITSNGLTVSLPDATDVALDIDLPKTTVTLESTGETGVTYKTITAKTATNTLKIGSGVVIESLTIEGGNVLLNGGTITKLVNNASDGITLTANVATTIDKIETAHDLTFAKGASGIITVNTMDVTGGKTLTQGKVKIGVMNHSSSEMLDQSYSTTSHSITTLNLNEGSAGAAIYGTCTTLNVNADNVTVTEKYSTKISNMVVASGKKLSALNLLGLDTKLLDNAIDYSIGTLNIKTTNGKLVKIASTGSIDKVVNNITNMSSSSVSYVFVVSDAWEAYTGTMGENVLTANTTTPDNVQWGDFYFPNITSAYQFAKFKDPSSKTNLKDIELKVLSDYEEPYLPFGSNYYNVTIDLNGKTVTLLGNTKGNENSKNGILLNYGSLTVKGSGKLASKDENSNWMFCVGGATLTIEGDAEYDCYHVGALANNKASQIYIKGGAWKASTTSNGSYWLMNKQDSYRATSILEVSGGRFYQWDPGNNVSEGAGTNFLATGYQSTLDGEWYIVSATE